jgi:hypothetical protein
LASAGEIPPGEEGKIDVEFDTSGRSGRQSKNVTVTTNDPDNTNVRLRVSADIEVLFGFEPSRIRFRRQRKNDIEPVTVNGTGIKLADVKIVSATLANPDNEKFFNINIEDTGSGSNRQIRLTLEPTEHIAVGRIRDRLIITTNLPEIERFEIFITGEILGPIDIAPSSLVMRSDSEDTPFTGSIRLRSDDTQFSVLSAECSDSNLDITVMPPGADGSVVIETSYPNNGQTSRFRSEITIRTDVPEQPEFNVPVFVQQARRRPDRTRHTR